MRSNSSLQFSHFSVPLKIQNETDYKQHQPPRRTLVKYKNKFFSYFLRNTGTTTKLTSMKNEIPEFLVFLSKLFFVMFILFFSS